MSGGFEAIRPPGRLQGLRTWWTMLKISLEERLVYRGDFIIGTLMRFLPIVTQVFLWTAVFNATSKADIAGYSRNDIVAYFLLTMVTRAFSSMPGLAGGIARSVRDGSVKKYLVQPVDFVAYLLAARIAHKLVYYIVAILPFAGVFYVCRNYFPPVPDAVTIVAYALSLVLSFLLGFFMEATLGMLGFWFLEVSSIIFAYMLVQYLLSGHMFPIDMLADIPTGIAGVSAADVIRWLPFEYTAYFYHIKSDVTKETIDKVLAYDYEGALEFFSKRKKIDKNIFTYLYTIEENNGSK
jgi:ABC-2 type transport system permease protein